MFGGRVFQQIIDLPMGSKCAPLLVDLFLYAYETDFVQDLLKKNVKNVKMYLKKSFKIPKGQSESVYRRRTDNTMAKRKNTKGQTTIYKTYI